MNEKKRDVVCVGFGCVDVLLEGCPSGEALSTFGAGMVRIRSATISPGGDALNEATVLAKLGDRVELICGVGEDDARSIVEQRARDVGFDVSNLVPTQRGKTLLSIVLMHDDGQHTFLSSGMMEDADYVLDPDKLIGAKIVSLASMFVPPFHHPQILLQAARTAKDAGAILCADCGFPKNGQLEEGFLPVFPYLDYFFPNEEEAIGMTGEATAEAAAQKLYELGVKNVVVKVGKRGCYLYNCDGGVSVPAYSHVHAVDTTGAGDNFAAGFIHGLLEGKSPLDCAKFATGVSAIAVQYIGASIGVENLEQVQRAIARMEQGLC